VNSPGDNCQSPRGEVAWSAVWPRSLPLMWQDIRHKWKPPKSKRRKSWHNVSRSLLRQLTATVVTVSDAIGSSRRARPDPAHPPPLRI
jgi:hypothetical protein